MIVDMTDIRIQHEVEVIVDTTDVRIQHDLK